MSAALVLSVVLPAYNEERSIERALQTIAAELERTTSRWEIVVVDDGSSDATASLAAACARREARIRVLSGRANRGKGYAVRRGVLDATGATIAFMDVDLSTPADEIRPALDLIRGGADLVVGTRGHPRSRVMKPQPPWRAAMGDVFRRATIRVLRLPVSDVTCGFKVFTRDTARVLFEQVSLDDWSFDAEVLYIAVRLGLHIEELPITWSDDPFTRVRPARDAIRAAAGVAKVLLRGVLGRYGRASARGGARRGRA